MRGVIASVIVAVGCYHPSATPGVPCASTGECPQGQHCDMSVVPPTCVAGGGSPDAGAVDAAVNCQGNADCTTGPPICDQTTKTCRGCRADAECPQPGVCVESAGQCFAANEVIWVSPIGTDAGTC